MNKHIVGGKAVDLEVINFIKSQDERVFVNGSFMGKGDVKENDILFINNHIDDNKNKDKDEYIKRYSHMLAPKVSSKMHDGMKLFNKKIRQKMGNFQENFTLKTMKCDHQFSKQPRCGHKAILHFLSKGFFPIIYGFTINIKDSHDTYYNIGPHDYINHHYDSEIRILRWLHEKRHIDLTPCMFSKLDNNIPVLDSSGLQPRKLFIEHCIDKYKECFIHNCQNPQELVKEWSDKYTISSEIENKNLRLKVS